MERLIKFLLTIVFVLWMQAVTYAVPDFKDSGAQQVMWWVILLAVLGGIIVLAIIIFILYKVSETL